MPLPLDLVATFLLRPCCSPPGTKPTFPPLVPRMAPKMHVVKSQIPHLVHLPFFISIFYLTSSHH
jgi:hypothetical protein